MRAFTRLLMAILLVTLPLRGIASALLPACATDDAPAVAASHDGCSGHGSQSGPAGEGKAPVDHSAHCSHCVACSGVAPMPLASLTPALAATAVAIPFRDHPASGFVPDRLDRPPLSA